MHGADDFVAARGLAEGIAERLGELHAGDALRREDRDPATGGHHLDRFGQLSTGVRAGILGVRYRERAEADDQQQQHEDHAVLGHPSTATGVCGGVGHQWIASSMICCPVAFPTSVISPLMRPIRMTRMRSAMPRTSGSSELISTTAFPAAASSLIRR